MDQGPGKFLEALEDGLVAFAKHQFQLAGTVEGGGTMREHLLSYERQTGRVHPELDGPGLPFAMQGLWESYVEICGRRQAGMGAAPLTYPDIDAWARLTKRDLDPWRVRVLSRVDDAWIEAQHKPKGPAT